MVRSSSPGGDKKDNRKMAMKDISVFDLKHQQDNVDSKIIVALEKMSEVFRVLLWNEGKELKLSPIQVQILIFIHHHSQEKCKVGYLAKEFNLTKPTVSDSIKILLQKGFLSKVPDENDSRSYSLELTKEGIELTKRAEHYTKNLQLPLAGVDSSKKEVLLESMLEVLHKMQSNGLIETQRMCFNCAHYNGDKADAHYCNFLKTTLNAAGLRIDCPEFEIAN